jgi:hypothetical protein
MMKNDSHLIWEAMTTAAHEIGQIYHGPGTPWPPGHQERWLPPIMHGKADQLEAWADDWKKLHAGMDEARSQGNRRLYDKLRRQQDKLQEEVYELLQGLATEEGQPEKGRELYRRWQKYYLGV